MKKTKISLVVFYVNCLQIYFKRYLCLQLMKKLPCVLKPLNKNCIHFSRFFALLTTEKGQLFRNFFITTSRAKKLSMMISFSWIEGGFDKITCSAQIQMAHNSCAIHVKKTNLLDTPEGVEWRNFHFELAKLKSTTRTSIILAAFGMVK
jgi:hypothetical protein